MQNGTASANGAIVDLKSVVKSYGELRAVDGVSLTIPSGICYALLGPNGAGKSTLSKMIGAMLAADSGSLSVVGFDPWKNQSEVKTRLGVVLQDDAFDEDLDVWSNLEIYGMFFWLRGKALQEKMRGLLRFMELEGREHVPIQELSGGMRRRLMIARALLNDPQLLILDEPTTGLDPQVRHAIWSALRKLKASGMTILLTTHYMEEAAQLADCVGIVNKGRLIAEDSPEELIAKNLPRFVLEFDAQEDGAATAALIKDLQAEQHGDRGFAFSNDEALLLSSLRNNALRDGVVRRSSLEDVFLKLTGRSLDE
ncbi:MAG TPA: ABC transporter ATP-binding protein [Planctomycetota bacterium]|nr:ABC transporter ATP-binding protein [Planctomycetota bacterium]